MDLKTLHEKLRTSHGEAIGEWVEVEVGDSWIEVAPESWHAVSADLRDGDDYKFDYLRLVSGVDHDDRIEVIVHLFSYEFEHDAIIKTKLDREAPKVASLADLWVSADWHERETYDLLGVVFEGHPELKRILLPDDWVGYPLRKDYKQPEEYHGITHW